MRPLTRIDPAGPVGAYQTYVINCPPDTMIKVACEQVQCPDWRHGWQTLIDERTDLGARQGAYIRTASGRTFREQADGSGVTVFTFESGQRCFREHHTRPEVYGVRDGDHRGNPTGRVVRHARPADWVEDLGGHQQMLADQQRRG